MKVHLHIFFISCFFLINVYGNNIDQDIIEIASIRFKVLQHGESNRRYIWIHGDEKTALLLLKRLKEKNNGTVFLIDNDKREVVINSNVIDPNRIFSRAGAEKNLIKMNSNTSRSTIDKTLDMLDRDRERFFDRIKPPNSGLLLALHNNLHGYSIHDEIAISNEVSLKNSGHPYHHNFYICTNRDDFDVLSKSPYNVVLQETPPPAEDNGSLSCLAARKGVRYINIETRLGYLSVQTKMLQYIEDHIE